MIVDVHTHIPTHVLAVPSGEERFDTTMRPDRRVPLTNCIDDYVQAMGPVDKALVFGLARLPGEGVNELMEGSSPKDDVNDVAALLASRYPEKVIGFMSVHPDDPQVIDVMDRCIHDLKLRGIKLAPNYQNFEPLGEPARRVYAHAQRNGLPIVFHQGTAPLPDAPLRYAHPLVMDEIAMAFPDLKIVMAHMGHPWHADCLMVVRKHANVYADISGQLYRPWSMYNGFRLAHEWAVTEKLFFASDWPVTTPQESIDSLKGFNRYANEHHLPEVPEEELKAILQRDALKLLGLE